MASNLRSGAESEDIEDPNLILTITAKVQGPTAPQNALMLSHNRYGYAPPGPDDVKSREITPYADISEEEEEEEKEDNSSRRERAHLLRLTFDHPPIDIGRGFSFGTEKAACDVLLGAKSRQDDISGIHFYITFNDDGRLVLIGQSETQGTAVSYNDWGGSIRRRRGFKWILFPGFRIQVHLPNNFTLGLVMATHQTCEAHYKANVSCYLHKSRDALPPFSRLVMESVDHTALPTEPLSPKPRPVYLPLRVLGAGSFGKVLLVTDVSTADVYAAKHFGKDCQFQNEVEIMRDIVHRHIVQFVDFVNEGSPQLIIEYLTRGNLEEEHNRCRITPEEAATLLLQCLQAIEYLHAKGVTHRDLKPANILVKSRDPLHVKLCDFGFARIADDNTVLKTFCGTHAYCAPEIYLGGTYSSAVDLWSLGVIVLEYAYGLSRQRLKVPVGNGQRTRKRGFAWCEDIIRQVNDWDSDPLIDLLSTGMLKIQPTERLSAEACLSVVKNLRSCVNHNSDLGSINPESQASQINDDDQAAIMPGALWDAGLPSSGPHHEAAMEGSVLQKRRRSPGFTSGPSTVSRSKRLQHSGSCRENGTYYEEKERGFQGDQLVATTMKKAVCHMLRDLNGYGQTTSPESGDVTALVSFICENVERLGITELHLTEDSEYATVIGLSGRGCLEIARLSEEDRQGTAVTIAVQLLRGLRHLADREAPISANKPPQSCTTSVGAYRLVSTPMPRTSPTNDHNAGNASILQGSLREFRRASSDADNVASNASWDPKGTSKDGRDGRPEGSRALRPTSPRPDERVLDLKALISRDAQLLANHAKQGCHFQSDDYFHLPFRTTSIAMRRMDCRLNATHILRAADVHRSALVRLRQSGVPFDDERGYGRTQGTYVDFERGLQLCRDYGLEELEGLLKLLLVTYEEHLRERNLPTTFLPKLKTAAPPSSLSPSPAHPGCHSSAAIPNEKLDLKASPAEDPAAHQEYPALVSTRTCIELDDVQNDHLGQDIRESVGSMKTSRSLFTEPSYSKGSYPPLPRDRSGLEPVHPGLSPPSVPSSTYGPDEHV